MSANNQNLELMLAGVTQTFRAVDLDVSTDKCYYPAPRAKPSSRLDFGADLVELEDLLSFIGTVVHLSGNVADSIAYRQAQTTKVYFKWKRVLFVQRRLDAVALLLPPPYDPGGTPSFFPSPR